MSTHPIRFGIASGQQLYEWPQLVELWKTADQVGYDSLWVSDHLYPILVPDLSESNFEGWTTLSALSQHTSRAKVGALVNCNGFRNPCLTAKMAATVDHASSGRFFLGKHYEVIDAVCSPKPVQRPRPPLMIAGQGEKVLLRIVAEHADIWNTQGSPERMRHLIEVMRRHGDTLGRDVGEIEKTVAIPLCYKGSKEREARATTLAATLGRTSPDEARKQMLIGGTQEC